MTKGRVWALVALAAVLGAVAVWYRLSAPPPPIETPAAPAPPALPQSVPAAPPEPAVKHPVELPSPALAADDIGQALTDLLGRKSVASFLQIDEFPRRFVATVDNLGLAHAPPLLWPVNPTAGRFTVEELENGPVIGADNAARYTPFVLLVETVNVRKAVDLYVRMYPLLQRAYEELGYPRGYFNDRLLAVIDLLLATPDPEEPLRLQLTQVKGPVPSVQPWLRYEFADPALESLSAGQKILLRVGPVNQHRLRAKLREIREEIVKRETKR